MIFLICILAVYFNVFQNVNAFTGGMNYHLWQSLAILTHLLLVYPAILRAEYLKNNWQKTEYFLNLVIIYVLVRFFIFDYAYGFFAHGDFGYLGNSIYDTIIGAFPVWLIAGIKSAGFLYAAYLNYKK